jgi:hypothetical protein
MEIKIEKAITAAIGIFIGGYIQGQISASRRLLRTIKNQKFMIDFEDSDDLQSWLNDGNDHRELKQVMTDYAIKKSNRRTLR